LSFVAYSRGRYLAGHLGDGVIASADADGQLQALSPPENGELANSTLFLTDHKAASRLRLYRGQIEATTGFAIMSDGTAESLYHKSSGVPAPAIQKLLEWNATLPRKKMKEVLGDNLQQSIASQTEDDCSIGLLSILKPSIGVGQTPGVTVSE
jgi:hypothetical protein